jgi:hypothetical protein
MEFNLKETLEQIKSHPLFLHLKDIVENSDGWHDKETVYDHLLKTANHANKFSSGNFITNPESREKFTSWMNEDFHGMKKSDGAILIGLLHDCGKILYYEEGGQKKSLIKEINGQTSCPGHEYWGGRLVVPELLKTIKLAPEIKKFIAEAIKVHGAFSDNYFPSKKDWSIDTVVSDIKARANGYYQESLFNQYVDCYDAPAFEYGKKKIEEVFNYSYFYTAREYFIL